jgi:hypothetical protein
MSEGHGGRGRDGRCGATSARPARSPQEAGQARRGEAGPPSQLCAEVCWALVDRGFTGTAVLGGAPGAPVPARSAPPS